MTQLKMGKLSLALLSAAAVTLATNAHATVVKALPDGTLFPFLPVNLFTTGPETVATGIVWTSTDTYSGVYGSTGTAFFGSNPQWSGMPAFVASGSVPPYVAPGSMTFAFASPVTAVGGFINWANVIAPAAISVYDENHTLIESLALWNPPNLSPNLIPPNAFYGFLENTADISYFTLSGGYIGLRDLTVVVPEPASVALLAVGLVGLAALRRERAA